MLEGATKYLYINIADDARSNQEIKIRVVVATSYLAKLKPVLGGGGKNMEFKVRMSLLRALITSYSLLLCM